MRSLHVWKESLENGNIAYTRELCDCPQPAYLPIAPLLLCCAKSLSWCHNPLPKLSRRCSGEACGQGSQIGPEIKRGCRCCSDRERLQVSTVLEKPHPLTTSGDEVWPPYWDCSELVKRSRWQGQSDRLRQDTASMNIHCFDKRYRDTCKPWRFFLAKC